MSNYTNATPLKPVSERESLHKALVKIKARRQGNLKSLETAWDKFNDSPNVLPTSNFSKTNLLYHAEVLPEPVSLTLFDQCLFTVCNYCLLWL